MLLGSFSFESSRNRIPERGSPTCCCARTLNYLKACLLQIAFAWAGLNLPLSAQFLSAKSKWVHLWPSVSCLMVPTQTAAASTRWLIFWWKDFTGTDSRSVARLHFKLFGKLKLSHPDFELLYNNWIKDSLSKDVSWKCRGWSRAIWNMKNVCTTHWQLGKIDPLHNLLILVKLVIAHHSFLVVTFAT
jgi:hypothetical protein